uniref:SET domain-containing protein n=1 Tax=Pristionchus pacificus TaxID=54126 RepID=A0A2A6BB05_PRIPA
MTIPPKGRKVSLCVFREPGAGWGVRTVRSMEAGDFVTEYCGEVKVGVPEAGKRYEFEMENHVRDPDTGEVLYEPLVISAADKGNEARFFNHSCTPNMHADATVIERYGIFYHHISFFTGRKIDAGEELKFDYFQHRKRASSETRRMFESCRCGAANCRFRASSASVKDVAPKRKRVVLLSKMNRNVSHRKAYNKSIVFHAFHGQDITLNQDLCRAVNTHGSTDGFVFSHRPISIGEQVCISQSYGPVGNGSSDGYLCFGVTTVDPVDLSVWQNFSYDEIREHDNSPNYWIKSIPQELGNWEPHGQCNSPCLKKVPLSTASRDSVGGHDPRGNSYGRSVVGTLQCVRFGPCDRIGSLRRTKSEMDFASMLNAVQPPGFVAASNAFRLSICSYCKVTVSDTAIVNCGHICVCRKCAELVKTGGTGCPMCRAQLLIHVRLSKTPQSLVHGPIQMVNSSSMNRGSTSLVDGMASMSLSNGVQTNQQFGPSDCSICLVTVADTAAIDCGHMCMCNGCAVIIKRSGDGCPICRKPIKDILKIFFSALASVPVRAPIPTGAVGMESAPSDVQMASSSMNNLDSTPLMGEAAASQSLSNKAQGPSILRTLGNYIVNCSRQLFRSLWNKLFASSANRCSICLIAPADMTVYPCGHKCMCNECAVIIKAYDSFIEDPCYWVKALPERFVAQGGLVQFSVNRRGVVTYSINGENKGKFLRGINTRCPLWVVVDVYDTAKSIEFGECW